MKINQSSSVFLFKIQIRKLFLIMKLVSFIMLIGALSLSASSYSQMTKIDLNIQNTNIVDILHSIENSSQFIFVYDAEFIKSVSNRSIDVKSRAINEILDKLFQGTDVAYLIDDRQVFLYDRKDLSTLSSAKALPLIVQQPSKKEISGLVKEIKGLPLPGVSVVVNGTTAGTITDADGKFRIVLPANAKTLSFSFVGMKTQEVEVDGKTSINITMVEESTSLEEVITVGYGIQKKINLTGSVANVSGDVLTERQTTNVSTMLEGLLPGVQVTQQNGAPGEGNNSILVRGYGTFSGAGVNPLVLIDGVPGDMDALNPRDIESVTVLKDAASASIYGSQAANGVILVVTKNGENSNGKLNVSYDFNYGIHSPTKLLDLVTNSATYMAAYNTYIKNSHYGVDIPGNEYTQADINEYANATNRTLYPNFDWEHFMIKPAPTNAMNISISGGKQTHFNLSLGYLNEDGTMKAFNYKRLNARLNIVSDVSKRLKIGANIMLKNGTTTSCGEQGSNSTVNYFLCILAQPPTIMPTLPGNPGLYSWRAFPFEQCNWNPYMQEEEWKNVNNDYAINSQFWYDFEMAKDLHWYTKGAVNYATSQFTGFNGTSPIERLYSDPTVLGYGSPNWLVKNNNQDIHTNVYTYLTYNKKISLHDMSLMVGYSNEEDNYN